MTCSECGYVETSQLRSADYYQGVRETASYLLGAIRSSSKEELNDLLMELYENADGLCRDYYKEHMLIKNYRPPKRNAQTPAEKQSGEGED